MSAAKMNTNNNLTHEQMVWGQFYVRLHQLAERIRQEQTESSANRKASDMARADSAKGADEEENDEHGG